jgi:diphthine-ammonia ligase
MKSLAYLWNREQKELLTDMINNQMNSVLIKVCAMGLDKIDLMKPISELKDKLFNLEQNNYLNVCGEGGEFESLTLDCPLYKKRINM